MEKRLKNKGKRGPAVLSVMIAAMLAVTLFAALPADGSSRESATLGAGEHNEDLTGSLPDVKAIAAGVQHVLILKSDGTVWAWGYNVDGQLGDGTNIEYSKTPVQVAGKDGIGYLTGVTAISTGGYHSLALKDDGTVWAWGYNECGELGDGTDSKFSNTPVQVVGKGGIDHLDGVIAISAGNNYSLALKNDGTVWAWGSSIYGQLGDGTDGWDIFVNAPVQVVGENGIGYLDGVTAISAGDQHSLALKNDGTVWAWGANWEGQLGDGTDSEFSSTPVQVLGENDIDHLGGVTVISAGSGHSLALKNDGTVWAWGANWEGQLGDGTDGWDIFVNAPVQVVGENGIGYLDGVTAISAGGYYSLVLKNDGTVWAWGSNGNGILGGGTDSDFSNTPVQVLGENGEGYLTGVTVITAGIWHSFVLKNDGTLWAWGENNNGMMGDGADLVVRTPVHIHIISSSPSYDETEHWYECPCGDIRTDAEEHVFDPEQLRDEKEHWYECGCGARATEEHVFEDIGDGNGECDCGAVYHSTDEDRGTSAGDGSAVKGNSPPVAMVFLAAVILAVSLTLMTVRRN